MVYVVTTVVPCCTVIVTRLFVVSISVVVWSWVGDLLVLLMVTTVFGLLCMFMGSLSWFVLG